MNKILATFSEVVQKQEREIIYYKSFGFLASILLAIKLVPVLLIPAYGLLGLYALRGPKQVIEAFSIMFILLMANPSLVPPGGKNLRWIVFFAGFAQTLWLLLFRSSKDNYQTSKLLLRVASFSLIVFPISLFVSKMALVSSLKLIAFSIGVFSIIISFERTRHLKKHWFIWFNTILLFIIFSSSFIYFFGMGFEKNGRGFQGIFNHPQVLGAISAILTAWFSSQIIFFKPRKILVALSAFILSWSFIYFSQARIGLLAVGAGLILSNIFYLYIGKKVPEQKRIFSFSSLIAISGIAFILFYPSQVAQTARTFVQKRNENAALAEAFQESRGFLLQASMDNFYTYPVFGIGFGVPTDFKGELLATSEAVSGLPTSTSVEKGFLPSAILEETGIIGAIITVYILFALIIPVRNRGHFSLLWILLSALLINVAEAVFYSIGGMGLMVWLIFGYCYNQTLPFVETSPNAIKRVPIS